MCNNWNGCNNCGGCNQYCQYRRPMMQCGPMGPCGPRGPMGPMGPTGPTGPAGPSGTTFTPSALSASIFEAATTAVAGSAALPLNTQITNGSLGNAISLNTANGTITTNQAGTYRFDWSFPVTNLTAEGAAITDVVIDLVTGTTTIATSTLPSLAIGSTGTVSGSVVYTATAGQTFSFLNNSVATGTTTPTVSINLTPVGDGTALTGNIGTVTVTKIA